MGLTQQQLADIVGVGINHLDKIEVAYSTPSLDIVEKALLGTVIISILCFKLGLHGFRGKPEYNVSLILTFDIQSLNCGICILSLHI